MTILFNRVCLFFNLPSLRKSSISISNASKYGNDVKSTGSEAATGFKCYLHHYLRDPGQATSSLASVSTFVEWSSSCITGLSWGLNNNICKVLRTMPDTQQVFIKAFVKLILKWVEVIEILKLHNKVNSHYLC